MSFGGLDQNTYAPMNEINTTPLVDVMLVLLIIFMVTAPLLTHSIRIDLPKAGAAAELEKPDIVTLSLNREGKLFWNDAPMEEGALKARLDAAAAQKPKPEIHLRADKETRYQKITEIMSAAKEAGIERLGFVATPQSH